MSSDAERKFISLRKRLDQLGFRQPLGIESLPLVEKLFSDLVHTTESLRNAKLSLGKSEKDTHKLDTALEPYQTENARLVRENNELHLSLLKMREEKDHLGRELKSYIRKLEHETSDLKFLNNQYVHKVRSLEKENKAKADRIQLLQEKNMQAVVQTPGGRKRSIPFRRQRMQIDDLIPPSTGTPLPVAQPDDPYVADLLQVADERIQELQQDVSRLKLELDRAQDGIKHLNTQVDERDQEIERLGRALDGGRPHDVITLEAQNISNEKLIAHLNLQIEYLHEANDSLRQQLQDRKQTASSDVVDLCTKNQELCQELSQLDQLAQQLQRDKDLVLVTADQELLEAKKEIQRQHREIEDLEDVINKLKKGHAESEHGGEQLQHKLMELSEQNQKLEGFMKFLQEEKQRLQAKVEKMTESEKELVLELEQMQAHFGVCGKSHSPSRLDAFVRSLEEERDFYKQEVERCQWFGRGNAILSPRRSGRVGTPRGGGWDNTKEELQRALQDRDELQTALIGVEKQMQDIQARVKTLTAERDTLSLQHQQAHEELLRLRGEVQRSGGAKQLQEQEEQMNSELRKADTEKEVLKQRLQLVLTEGVEKGNKIEILERSIRTLQEEVFVLREGHAALQEELQSRVTALLQVAEEANQQRSEADALRLVQQQMEKTLSDSEHQLSVKKSELKAAHRQIKALEETIAKQSHQDSSHHEEVTVLQRAVSALDQEKDTLQEQVDQKTEQLAVLKEELNSKEKTLTDVRVTITDMESSLSKLRGSLSGREREIGSLQRQLDAAQDELSEVGRQREVVLKENRRLQDDLATMTKENQAVHVELEDALHQKDELKMRVHSYIAEVARVEKMMAVKQQENQDILERFRIAHLRAEDWEHKLQQAEGLNSSIRLELLSADTERRHLRERLTHLEREVQQHLSAQQAYEQQTSSLVKSVARLEEELQAAYAERASAQADLASVRELSVKLDSCKEIAARQLVSKSMERDRLAAELEDLRSEAELLKKQLTGERLSVKNLETLLSSARQKEFHLQLCASEQEAELKALRERLGLADTNAAGHTRELSQLRGKLSQLQTEMDVLRRQLTTERFERERAVQEMHRQGLSFSTLHSSSPISSSHSPQPLSPDHSILRTPERYTEKVDKSPEKNVSFKE